VRFKFGCPENPMNNTNRHKKTRASDLSLLLVVRGRDAVRACSNKFNAREMGSVKKTTKNPCQVLEQEAIAGL
jgi:hypothetical protein